MVIFYVLGLRAILLLIRFGLLNLFTLLRLRLIVLNSNKNQCPTKS